ncbi:transposase [Robbsia sp. Bb-Pol-6]|uniref:Transposase n=1 Tax=Robbsia betulipollinis TaxID=2981849 RepID=A0ABT3ZTW8_9BURK|nr:transposase [Robbsia betulipollinis]MCY0389978.1 transposase [Robbsia betulipollinis]
MPDDVEALKRMVERLSGEVRALEVAADVRSLLIENLQIQIAALRRAMYGRKSEKMEQEVGQLELKLEEVLLDKGEDPPPQTPEAIERTQRTRKPLPEHLPRETIDHAPPHDQCSVKHPRWHNDHDACRSLNVHHFASGSLFAVLTPHPASIQWMPPVEDFYFLRDMRRMTQ